MKFKFFKAKKIYDNVTLIAGLGGVGSLKAFVRELTDLPVALVNTHGHVDHIGADFEYPKEPTP